MSVLEFDSFDLEFGMNRVLASIYMRCETGKITALLGRNGSGKSCLMKIVFGSMDAGHKSVRIDGKPLSGNYLHRNLISYLPQGNFLPSFIEVRQAFEFFKIKTSVVENSFPEFNEVLKKRVRHLSTGQRRLLEVMLILFSPHPFCILDEPFSGLAPLQIQKLQMLMQELKMKKGILVTDHLHEQVRLIASDVYLLNGGKTYLITDEEQLMQFGYLSAF